MSRLSSAIAPRHAALLSILCLSALGLLLGACSEDVTGPGPEISSPVPGQPLPAAPGIVCLAQLETTVVVTGDRFSPVPVDLPDDPRAHLPAVTLVHSSGLVNGAGSGAETTYGGDPKDRDDPNARNAALLSWQSPQQMSFVVNQGLFADAEGAAAGPLAEGIYDVRVTNPNGNGATSVGALAVSDKPTLTDVAPDIVCIAQGDKDITLTGGRFLQIEGATPTAVVGDSPAFDTTLGGCQDVNHVAVSAAACTEAVFTLPQGSVAVGSHIVRLDNPETAACVTEETDKVLYIAPPPNIVSVVPPTVCRTAPPADVVITGTNFLVIDDVPFTVTLSGTAVTPTNLVGCADIPEVTDVRVVECTGFTVPLDPAGMTAGAVEIVVTNPPPADCNDSDSTLLAIVDPPVLTSVEPTNICSDVEETFTIRGTGLADGATVTVNGVVADTAVLQADGSLEVTFASGLPAGTYDVTVSNGPGCDDTLAAALTVDPTPLVFFVDPPVLYNGVSIEVTIFTTNLYENAATVALVSSGGTVTELAFSSPDRPNRIQATVPAGLPADQYEVQVTSAIGCVGSLPGGVTIVAQTTLGLEDIEPAFVSPNSATGVTLTAESATGFVSTPRVYLNPNPAGTGVTATALRAVVFLSASTLTAVVPAGMTPGEYDVIVVNPLGSQRPVGILEKGLTVTPGEPPVIDALTPSALDTGGGDVTITGSGFTTDSVTVEADCVQPGELTPTTVTLPVSGGVAAGSVTVTFSDTLGFGAGTVCVVRLINSDGARTEFSAISLTNPSFNLNDWTEPAPMTEARRAPGFVAGRPTRASRYLYAIGGDDSNLGNAKTSVEGASVDSFGRSGLWRAEFNALPGARTMAQAVTIDRFVYLIGGFDGAEARDTVWRAQILDPLAGPEVVDLDADLAEAADGTGLGGGLWFYQVAATFPDTDTDNPSGEGMPGEVLNVQLPTLSDGDKILLTLSWEKTPGATGYRLYRSAAADGSVDDLELLAVIDSGDTLTYLDDGAGTTEGAVPLIPGSLGKWHPIATLQGARYAHAASAFPDPTVANQWLIYVFGGNSGAGLLDSVEYVKVTIAPDGTQTMGTWVTATATLESAKSELSTWLMRPEDSSLVADNSVWIYVGAGRMSGDNTTGEIEAVQITGGDPDFANFTAVNGLSGQGLSGAATIAANGNLYLLGGRTGGVVSNHKSTEMQSPAPTLANWNSLGGGSPQIDRAYAGVVQESAFFFIAGGIGTDGAPLMSVEQTVR